VADGIPGVMPVRDGKSPDEPTLPISSPGWSAFVAALKNSNAVAS
jgi:hypothetical protein